MADNFLRDLFKYGVFAALFFAGLITVLELTGVTNWNRLPWLEERNQGTQEKVDFLKHFKHELADLKEWPSPEFSESITDSEIQFAEGVTEVNAFAKTLERAMREFETTDQKDMVHRFAMTLEKKQRSFFTRARLFTEYRLNHHLADTGIRVHVPLMRNKTLEINGAGLDTAEKKDQFFSRYKKDLSLARFQEIQWEPKFDGTPIERTRLYGAEDDTIIVVRERGSNFHFSYHY